MINYKFHLMNECTEQTLFYPVANIEITSQYELQIDNSYL